MDYIAFNDAVVPTWAPNTFRRMVILEGVYGIIEHTYGGGQGEPGYYVKSIEPGKHVWPYANSYGWSLIILPFEMRQVDENTRFIMPIKGRC